MFLANGATFTLTGDHYILVPACGLCDCRHFILVCWCDCTEAALEFIAFAQSLVLFVCCQHFFTQAQRGRLTLFGTWHSAFSLPASNTITWTHRHFCCSLRKDTQAQTLCGCCKTEQSCERSQWESSREDSSITATDAGYVAT